MRDRLRKFLVSFSVRPVNCTTIRPSKKHRALFLDWLKRRFQVSRAQCFSDISDDDLQFVAATGPKASEVMKFRVPMGQGIVGFAAQEGVSLAVSDVEKDDRFYKDISDKIGYPVIIVDCIID